VAADVRFCQPHRAQLAEAVGGEVASQGEVAGDLEVLTV
jgi:hypothetical protein